MRSLDQDGLKKFKQLSEPKLKSLSFKFTGVGAVKTISVEGGPPTDDLNDEPAAFSAWWSMVGMYLGVDVSRFLCPQAAVPYGGGRVSSQTHNGLELITADGKHWFLGIKSGTLGLVLGSGNTISEAVSAATPTPGTIPPSSVSSESGFDIVFY